MDIIETLDKRPGETARRMAGLLNLAGWLTGIWGIVYPLPYVPCLSVLMAFPVAAFVFMAVTRQRWRIGLDGMVFLPAMALGMRALFDDYLVDATIAIGVVLALAVAITALVAAIERQLAFRRIVYILVLSVAWSWGSLVWLNDALDNSEPKLIPVQVQQVTVLTPKTRAFDLYVSAWGPYDDGHPVEVSSALLRKTHVGDTVCIHIRPGRFGWAHYLAEDCPA